MSNVCEHGRLARKCADCENVTLADALERVRKLHQPYETISHTICTTCTEPGKGHQLYPCATIKAIEGRA